MPAIRTTYSKKESNGSRSLAPYTPSSHHHHHTKKKPHSLLHGLHQNHVQESHTKRKKPSTAKAILDAFKEIKHALPSPSPSPSAVSIESGLVATSSSWGNVKGKSRLKKTRKNMDRIMQKEHGLLQQVWKVDAFQQDPLSCIQKHILSVLDVPSCSDADNNAMSSS